MPFRQTFWQHPLPLSSDLKSHRRPFVGVSGCRSWSRFIAFEENYRQKLTNLLEIDFLNTPTKGLACPGHSGVRGPRPQDAGAIPPATTRFIKLPGLVKLTNTESFAAWIVVVRDATADEIRVERPVHQALRRHCPGYPGVRGPRPQDAGALPPATTRFIKLPGLVK